MRERKEKRRREIQPRLSSVHVTSPLSKTSIEEIPKFLFSLIENSTFFKPSQIIYTPSTFTRFPWRKKPSHQWLSTTQIPEALNRDMAPPPETPSRHTFGMLSDQPPNILSYESLLTNEGSARDLHKLYTSDASFSNHGAMRRLVEYLEYVNTRKIRVWHLMSQLLLY
jgi:hypothetical protein